MKYRLFIILTVLTSPSFGQDIERIIFTSQQADEPPTNQGRPKYAIEFTRQPNGELVASDFFENTRKKKLKSRFTIDKNRIEKVIEWRELDKKTFNQTDLQLDLSSLQNKATSYKLNFDIPTNLTVSVDSFQFCQTYKLTKSISTGGEKLTVTFVYKSGQKHEIVFDSDDIGQGVFKLNDYVLCYTLLTDRIPNEVPSYGFFSKDNFEHIVLHYQKTVECEGFYYKEFTDKNPKMTAKDKRMMTGWDFVDYMKQRNTKE
jgi:hypothetical protein